MIEAFTERQRLNENASNGLQIPMGLQLTRGGGGGGVGSGVGGSIAWSHDIAETVPETLFQRLFANASVRGSSPLVTKTRRRRSSITKTRKASRVAKPSTIFSFFRR